MGAGETNFYVLVQTASGLVCPDFFKFGFYAREGNLTAIKDFMKWLEKTAIEGEKEWLEDSSPDKCGLSAWLQSDDPFKNDPANSKRVRDYLNSFSILLATSRLKQSCMDRHETCEAIPYKLSEAGIADLDTEI